MASGSQGNPPAGGPAPVEPASQHKASSARTKGVSLMLVALACSLVSRTGDN
jgi:hypothetical protein